MMYDDACSINPTCVIIMKVILCYVGYVMTYYTILCMYVMSYYVVMSCVAML